MWSPTTRRQHSRSGLRYGSDTTDAEWQILEPLLPGEAACGRKWAWPMREIVNGIFYVLRGGVAWRLLPRCFPPPDNTGGSASMRSPSPTHFNRSITSRR